MSNLLEKASIVTTPTAYENGKILSVKPNTSVGDFDFTRNSSATRVNSQGLIEDVQILSSNLVSNGDFSNGSTGWTLSSAWNIGTNKAIFSDTIGGDIRTSSSVFTANKKYQIKLTVADLTSGTAFFGVGDGAANNLANYANYANGEHTFNVTAPIGQELRIYSTTSSGSSYSITNISIIEITDDTNLPRIDYTGGEGHWLFEPQSTNLIPYSEDFSTYSVYTGASIQQNYSTSPDGLQNATKLNLSANSFSRIEQIISGSFASQTHTVSLWARCASNTEAFRLKCTNRGYVDYYSENKTATTQWQKFSFSATFGSVSGDIGAAIANSTDAQERSIEIFGFQVEANKSFSTSYIPTEGAIKTRLQDAAFGAGSSDLINSTEGVLYAEIAALANDGTNRNISLSKDTGNRVNILYRNGSNRMRFIVRVNNVNVFDTSITLSDIVNYNKVALSFKENEFKVYVNGVKEVEQLSGSIFPINTLDALNFDQVSGAQPFFGKTKCVAVFKEALTDAELTCLTTI